MQIFNPFEWYSQYQIEKLRLKLDAQTRPYVVMAQCIQSQADFIKEYFGNFKVTEIPTSTVYRDEDAYVAEQNLSDPHRNLKESIRNALGAGAMPELKDILNS